jgi:MioC protein
VRYGLIALGDSLQYPQTFANGGRRFDERLRDLGAVRIGEPLILDASSDDDPEAVGAAWCRQWLTQALAVSDPA